MSEETTTNTTFGERLGLAFLHLLRVFVRLLVLLIVVGGIAALVYYGTPWLYQNYILPVESNTARVQSLETRITDENLLLNNQFSQLQERLIALESLQTDNAQAIADLQGRLDQAEKTLAAHTATLRTLDEIQANLEVLNETVAGHELELTGGEGALADLNRQIRLVRAMELLTRARMFLFQSNFGLARQDVQAARDTLSDLESEVLEFQVAPLQNILARLDLALANLPDFPVIARDDVDIAWQLLLQGLPANPPEDGAVPTPAVPTATPTP